LISIGSNEPLGFGDFFVQHGLASALVPQLTSAMAGWSREPRISLWFAATLDGLHVNGLNQIRKLE
jgi:hypothetical protein